MRGSNRISDIGSYAFAEVDKVVESLKAKGVDPIDFGVGDPQDPTPEIIRKACREAIEKRKASGYPSYAGSTEYRSAISLWVKKRFGVNLNPEEEITSTLGAKEAVFHMPLAFVNKDDCVIIPNPFYPPYERGTIFCKGKCFFLPLEIERNFLLDLESVPKEIVDKTRILWINYPSNPTGALATPSFFKEVVDFAQDNDILVVSDECYSEMYFDKKPRSILEFGYDNVLVIQSLSKRSNMTNYRIGWVMGDSKAIELFRKVKTNIDSGTPTFIQDAAVAALSDESHVQAMRESYRKKRDVMCRAFSDIGLTSSAPEATFYIWQEAPEEMESVSFSKRLLGEDVGIVTTPGRWLSKEICGKNPGENFIRLALVPSLKECELAAERIREADLFNL
ncbi:MAG: aminotransferase class I/II-fold pyridoxal phosphate-dependent enzyme [Candidatus Methanofastidiosia archaeon]